MARVIQGGSATPVVIVGTENPDGSTSVSETGGVGVSDLRFNPYNAHVDGLSISSAQTLTPPDSNVTKLLIQALTQNVRITLDGATTPTATIGFQIKAGDPMMIIPIGSRTVIRVIEEASGADLQYQWGT